MLIKESNDTAKQALFFAVLSLVIPLILKMALQDPSLTYFELFLTMYPFGLLGFALFLGNSLFLGDRKQRAGDYLFSLPYSRLQLLGIKILPRLVTLVVFYLLFLLLLRNAGDTAAVIPLFTFPYLYITVFIIALSFSATMENYILTAAVTLFAVVIFRLLFFLLYVVSMRLRGIEDTGSPVPWLLHLEVMSRGFPFRLFFMSLFFLLPFIISFVFAFKKTGIHPTAHFNKRYFVLFVPLMAVALVLSFSMVHSLPTPSVQKHYYLTAGWQLIESGRFGGTRVYRADQADQMSEINAQLLEHWTEPVEADGKLYIIAPLWNGSRILRVDLETLETETLYKRESWMGHTTRRLWYYKNTIAAAEDAYDSLTKALILVDAEMKKVTRIEFHNPRLNRFHRPRLCGTGENAGKRWWIICSHRIDRDPVMLLWENGNVEDLGMSTKNPYFLNGMLITFQKKAVLFRKMTGQGMTLVKRVPMENSIRFLEHERFRPDRSFQKDVYFAAGVKGKTRYFKMDLGTFESRKIAALKDIAKPNGFNRRYSIYRIPSGHCYLLEHRRNNISAVYTVTAGGENGTEVKLLKRFPSQIWVTYFSENGIIQKQPDGVKIYAFPDLKELEFKGLER
ncbi:MAG: hypothetical protein GY950_28400 [bacterium]|nr:hypothetical protein [bacterium]